MAIVQIAVANPTATDVVVNTKTAKKGTVTVLGLDDATTDSELFLAAKCALVSVSAQSDLSSRSAASFLLHHLQHRQ
jgi:hypothetical protein